MMYFYYPLENHIINMFTELKYGKRKLRSRIVNWNKPEYDTWNWNIITNKEIGCRFSSILNNRTKVWGCLPPTSRDVEYLLVRKINTVHTYLNMIKKSKNGYRKENKKYKDGEI